MRVASGAWACALSGVLWANEALAQETVLTLEGEVPTGEPDHLRVPFEVPEGVAEIEVRHDDLSDDNILDWGLEDPRGFRGWGGGNSEPAIVGALAASRSYLTGPVTAGTWNVVIGKAKIVAPPASYAIEIVLRQTPSLPPQPERTPYVAPAALSVGERWYEGDFHVHSRESGDARPPLDEILTFAKERGLDFVVITDHNTTSHLDFFVDAQSRHPEVLLVPGVEWTSYDGHAGAFGATTWVDHKVGLDGVTATGAIEAYREMGAIFSVNHPALDIGNLCIGCAWKHEVDLSLLHAVELGTGSGHTVFLDETLAFWEQVLDAGGRAAALGGSDDHRAGEDVGPFGAPIGSPLTMVHATELSVDAILEGVRSGRTVVRLPGREAPMVELTADGLTGDSVASPEATVRARVTGPGATDVRFVVDGVAGEPVPITSDPFEVELVVDPGPGATTRVRVEALAATKPVTITSHVFVGPGAEDASDPSDPPPPEVTGAQGGGCACTSVGHGGDLGVAVAVALASLGLASVTVARRRRRENGRARPADLR